MTREKLLALCERIISEDDEEQDEERESDGYPREERDPDAAYERARDERMIAGVW